MARYRDLAGSSMALFKALKRSFNPNLFRFEKTAAPRMAGHTIRQFAASF
jgi:hypothetical protein